MGFLGFLLCHPFFPLFPFCFVGKWVEGSRATRTTDLTQGGQMKLKLKTAAAPTSSQCRPDGNMTGLGEPWRRMPSSQPYISTINRLMNAMTRNGSKGWMTKHLFFFLFSYLASARPPRQAKHRT
ncbi:uncharacterized protein BDZ83DRAFT_175391 [Colletotrichum acutatum]|uniref:Secreted protein n=1 Tax=Glomerella acutata TaxID=27357 RepID=A0AAD8XBP7_GLOAC|nr:uncharacterized protein BDZ83DRAFT_175391 [Colletotrichum acutatum]KAK1707727.1 hypothetical protein BDZ83DRAFT_175391 [Colletotrichum acutatum]